MEIEIHEFCDTKYFHRRDSNLVRKLSVAKTPTTTTGTSNLGFKSTKMNIYFERSINFFLLMTPNQGQSYKTTLDYSLPLVNLINVGTNQCFQFLKLDYIT